MTAWSECTKYMNEPSGTPASKPSSKPRPSGAVMRFQPVCGTFNPCPGTTGTTSPGMIPSPACEPNSALRESKNCIPRQMPSTGRPSATCVAMASGNPRASSSRMPSPNAPTPGRSTWLAPASAAPVVAIVTSAPM